MLNIEQWQWCTLPLRVFVLFFDRQEALLSALERPGVAAAEHVINLRWAFQEIWGDIQQEI